MFEQVVLPENLQGKTILIAGVAGFVPHHVAEFYLKLGAKVIGLDNFITGSRANIQRLAPFKNFSFIECNIYKNLPDFAGVEIDYIFSLASPASPIDFKKIPMEIYHVNTEGTRLLLELSLQKKARFLEASTSEVYGDPEVHPQPESYLGAVNTLGPRAIYDESKRMAETLTSTYQRLFGADTRIIRIFNTYGPGMRANDGRVIPNFINQALQNQDLTVYGDGTQTRSFCFVSDLVMAMHTVMFSNDSSPFNCGNPDEYTIIDCAREIIKALDSSSSIIFKELPEDDPKQRRPVLDKLQSISDFAPQVSFSEGIQRTAEYFRGLL